MTNIISKAELFDARYIFTHEVSYGHLVATFYPVKGLYCIADIEVERSRRRRGIGKLLLTHSLQEAKDVRARIIYATIVSRECLDAMTSVFGADVITIERRGDYTNAHNESEIYNASAFLKVVPDYT